MNLLKVIKQNNSLRQNFTEPFFLFFKNIYFIVVINKYINRLLNEECLRVLYCFGKFYMIAFIRSDYDLEN